MLKVDANCEFKGYNIYIKDNLDELCELLKGYTSSGIKVFILTDSRVHFIYNNIVNLLEESLGCIKYVFNEGEDNKNLNTVTAIYDFLIKNNADRSSILIALGGGVVGDIAGFVASTFMRGIRYISIPTTLVSQVDSSVGGKVGCNYGDIKNIVGAFYNPEFVYIDTSFLNSLSNKQILDGLGEVIKYGLIYSKELLLFIEQNPDQILSADSRKASYIVKECLKIKTEVISKDFKDTGLRNILNFGHTVGHGIEAESNYAVPHGIAVALGMLAALKLSEKYCGLSSSVYNYVVSLYKKLNLPTSYKVDNYDSFLYAIRHDKKNNDKINFVLLKDIGNCIIKAAVKEEDILWAVNNCFQEE